MEDKYYKNARPSISMNKKNMDYRLTTESNINENK
jgi:hypothetical protein